MSNTENKTPAYVNLCTAIARYLDANGIPLKVQSQTIDGVPGNKNWACFERADNGQKIYVPRSADGTGVIHTTVPLDPATPGYVDPKGKNPGKVEAFYTPDEVLVTTHLLPAFCSTEQKLRSNRTRKPATNSTQV